MLTQEQKKARLGKITGSIMDVIMNGSTTAWINLLEQKKIEIEQPDIAFGEEVRAPALDWGNTHEPKAIDHYELIYNVNVEVPKVSVQHPTVEYVAALPDFILPGLVGEVKCPYNEEVHAMTVVHGMGAEVYKAQIQCEIWCTGKPMAHFVSYDPRYTDPHKQLIVIPVERDDAYIARMEEKCAIFWNYLTTDTRPEDFGGFDTIPEIF